MEILIVIILILHEIRICLIKRKVSKMDSTIQTQIDILATNQANTQADLIDVLAVVADLKNTIANMPSTDGMVLISEVNEALAPLVAKSAELDAMYTPEDETAQEPD
jgi:hypothetical protein